MSFDIEPGEEGYFEQQISRKNFSTDVISYIHSKFRTSTKALSEDPDLNAFAEENFDRDDYLGRTWFRMWKEVTSGR